MKILKSGLLIVAIIISLSVFASGPVAIRVEVEPMLTDGDGTRVALTVQVSPEDRARVGKNAMLRIELDGDVPPGQSPLWAVRIEKDGSGRIETVWPPGEHALRVEISNPSGTETGLWVGTVRIPGEDTGEDEPEVAAQPPEPVAVSTPEPIPTEVPMGAAAAGAVVASPPEDSPPAASSTTEKVAVDERSVTEGAPAPLPETEGPAIDQPPIEEPPPAVSSPSDDLSTEIIETEPDPDVAAAAVAAVAAGAADADVASGSTGNAEVEPPAPTPSDDMANPIEDPTIVEPESAVVEPLRSDLSAPPPDPGGEVSTPTESPLAAAAAPPAVVAALEEWEDAGPGAVDLTVVVTRDRSPVSGLAASDFRLRVGGSQTNIDAVGDADRAPLQLGVAVDVAAESAASWSRAGGRLFSLVQRTRAGRGHAFFAADGRVGEWDTEPEVSRPTAGDLAAPGLTGLIADSLARFDGRFGRTFLVVVTDGRSDDDKAGWKIATQAAADSGVPVLVIALWDDNFSHRIRKNLKSVADVSGGGLFLVQGSDQLDRAAERFGPMIDGGVALRFTVPSTVALPAPVAVETTDKTLTIVAPSGVK